MPSLTRAQEQVNHSRYRREDRGGHYESFFQRANHPTRPLAFWIRYTLFSPRDRPEHGIGELWAIFFDGESNEHVVVKKEVPIERADFSRDRFSVTIDDARLDADGLRGAVSSGEARVAWDLTYEKSGEPPLFLFPLSYYDLPFPRAKSLVGVPLARYRGTLRVNDRDVDVTGWTGSQNHNWGPKHTDEYAWVQVAGFDDDPSAFLEAATARLHFGSLKTPYFTPMVLRHRGREIAIHSLWQAFRAEASYRFFDWRFRSESREALIEGHVSAPREAFVGLRYGNPPGGEKHCLNSKLAACELSVTYPGQPAVRLVTKNRAAFEILTDERDHGVGIRA